jgi:hypothetical protein
LVIEEGLSDEEVGSGGDFAGSEGLGAVAVAGVGSERGADEECRSDAQGAAARVGGVVAEAPRHGNELEAGHFEDAARLGMVAERAAGLAAIAIGNSVQTTACCAC